MMLAYVHTVPVTVGMVHVAVAGEAVSLELVKIAECFCWL